MIKPIIFFVLLSSTWCSPAYGQDIHTITTEYAEAVYEPVIKYNNAVLNIREQPTTQSYKLGQLELNTPVEVVSTENGWSQIALEGGYGYVAAEYLADTPSSNRWGILVTPNEFSLLCRITMLEAGGESDIGQQAVVETILNRVVHPEYPNTIYEVLSQKGQFVTWKNRNSSRAVPTERVIRNVRAVISGKTHILPFPTVYFSRDGQNNQIQSKIGGHIFCNY